MSKEQTVVDFYVLCNKLKNTIRTGWKQWNVNSERIESVAEHIYGVQMLAIAMWSEYDYKIDLKKVLFMLSIHELEEIVIGDLTIVDIDMKTKKEIGHTAVENILGNLTNRQEIKSLVYEFDDKQTPESQFANCCDKLECDIQCKLYDEQKCVDLDLMKNSSLMNIEPIKNLIEENNSWSKAWIKFSQQKYNYDENFRKVSDYIMSNEILKNQ